MGGEWWWQVVVGVGGGGEKQLWKIVAGGGLCWVVKKKLKTQNGNTFFVFSFFGQIYKLRPLIYKSKILPNKFLFEFLKFL